jgi:hypothetical protein
MGMGTVEIDAKKLDINACINGLPPKHRELVYFIRIGVNTDLSPKKIEMQKYSDGRLIVTPPRLNGLRINQQSFRKLMEPFVWNYILEKDLDEDDDSSIDEDDSIQSLCKSPTSPPPLTAVSAAAITPARASSLNDNDMSKLYPNLSHALGDDDGFFDPTDPLVDKSMRGLLKELNHLLSTKYELNLRGISNQYISYVRVPRTTSDHTFTNSKEWLDTAIKISGSIKGDPKKDDTYGSAYRIANHLIKYYRDSFLAACETQRVPVIKPMTATEFQAMLYAGKVSGTGERESSPNRDEDEAAISHCTEPPRAGACSREGGFSQCAS